MIFKDSVTIQTDIEKVWAYISDFRNSAKWNPKIKKIEIITQGDTHIGYVFRVTYAMSGKQTELDAEVTAFEKPHKLIIQYQQRFQKDPNHLKADFQEEYHCVQIEDHTKLTQVITVYNSGIPWPFRILIAFIQRFGKPVNGKYLDDLKRLIEEN